jgi:hypothetical protein
MISASRAAALAPAAVGLAMFISAVQLRMGDSWADGVLLLVTLVPAALLLLLGLEASRGNGAHAASTILLVAGLVLTASAIAWLGQILGGDDATEGGGNLTWMLALFTAIAGWCAARGRSPACLLIAALAAVGLVNEAVNWIFDTENIDTFRVVLIICFAVLFAAGWTVSGRNGTVLVGAAGVTLLVSAYVLGFAQAFSPEGGDLGWGWELVALLEGLALLAYAALELEPGPGYLAFFVLGIFTIGAAGSAGLLLISPEAEDRSDTLVGWPLALGVGTVLAALWGLRRAADA